MLLPQCYLDHRHMVLHFSVTLPGLTRTESVGRSESERPKGILKRTPSLKQTGVNVDPELAEVLKSRRQRHEDVEEEDEGTRRLSVQEEIRQIRYVSDDQLALFV